MTPDIAYSNAAFIPLAETFPPRWQAQAAAFRAAQGTRALLDQPYGPGARQRCDLFLPKGPPLGVMLLVHGGYWKAFGRQDWSHLAAGALGRGWACGLPSYTLAPDARIAEITAEIARALAFCAEKVAGPVVVTGHSAGGHLAARMGCDDSRLDAAVALRLRRVVPVSPVAELEPLIATAMNETLRIDAGEAARESPARLPLRASVQAHVWVGGQERPAFLWQARLLAEHWCCDWTVDPGRHHFDVVDGYTDPTSPLMEACLADLP